jgi:hypothetical protein
MASSSTRAALAPDGRLARVVRCKKADLTPPSYVLRLSTMPKVPEKPSWVEALEESLLLAIGLFTLITWIVMIGLLAH